MPNLDMVQFRSCFASELDSRDFIAGSFVFCTDTGRLYRDTATERIQVSKAVEFLATESSRTSMLTPEEDIMYVVLESGKIYIYNGGWVKLNKTTEYFNIHNVAIEKSATTECSDSRITANDTAVFVPYPEFTDLVTDSISCTCSAGKISIINSNSYGICGIIEVTSVA